MAGTVAILAATSLGSSTEQDEADCSHTSSIKEHSQCACSLAAAYPMPGPVTSEACRSPGCAPPRSRLGSQPDDGALVADDAAAADLVSGFAPSRAWDDMALRGGPEGVVARRPISMRGQQAGWVYDLWLCERLAGALGATLPGADLDDADTPYDMG
jgi:hypothetical protein